MLSLIWFHSFFYITIIISTAFWRTFTNSISITHEPILKFINPLISGSHCCFIKSLCTISALTFRVKLLNRLTKINDLPHNLRLNSNLLDNLLYSFHFHHMWTLPDNSKCFNPKQISLRFLKPKLENIITSQSESAQHSFGHSATQFPFSSQMNPS